MLTCMMTNSTQWAENKALKPRGIVIHSTGRCGSLLKRYVQPSKKDKNYRDLITLLGENRKHNDWNHIHTTHNFHYWIGKNNNNKIMTIQTFPLSIKVWKDNYIHICICEDNLKNKMYLEYCLTEVVDICYQICNIFQWNETYIHDFSEIFDAPDANYWFKKFGYSINWVRQEVKNLLDE